MIDVYTSKNDEEIYLNDLKENTWCVFYVNSGISWFIHFKSISSPINPSMSLHFEYETGRKINSVISKIIIYFNNCGLFMTKQNIIKEIISRSKTRLMIR